MADAPWIKWFTSDFLNGVADLEADEIGIYAVILNLQADKGAPIEDDGRWLARRCGTSTRRFNQVRARLIALGKLEARAGLLANTRMMAEIDKRDGKSKQARDAAYARWHGDREPELPLDQDGTDDAPVRPRARSEDEKTKIKSGKTQEQNDLISVKNQPKSQKSAIPADADASPPVRARKKLEDSDSTQPDPPDSPPVRAREGPASRLDDTDLKALYDAVAEASGHNPTGPDRINRAMGFVEAWRKAGISFDDIVIPTIRSEVASSSEPTRTLGRFDARVRHEHARRGARARNGAPYRPPASPLLDIEGEDTVFSAIRHELHERLGTNAYCLYANTARFEIVQQAGAGRKPMRVIEHGPGRLADAGRDTILRAIARRHGFTEVW